MCVCVVHIAEHYRPGAREPTDGVPPPPGCSARSDYKSRPANNDRHPRPVEHTACTVPSRRLFIPCCFWSRGLQLFFSANRIRETFWRESKSDENYFVYL